MRCAGVEIAAPPRHDVFWKTHPTQDAVNAAVSEQLGGCIVRKHNAEIQIAVGTPVAAGFGAEQLDALGAAIFNQPICDRGNGLIARHRTFHYASTRNPANRVLMRMFGAHGSHRADLYMRAPFFLYRTK